MRWIIPVTALCFALFAGMILYLVWEQRRIYRPLTKVFCCLYAAYLLARVFTMPLEPFTTGVMIRALFSVILFAPMIAFVARVMRLGDPFEIAKVINQLQQLRKKRDELAISTLHSPQERANTVKESKKEESKLMQEISGGGRKPKTKKEK